MKSLTKKKTKVWLVALGSVLLATILVLSGIGVYFKLSKKDKGPQVEIGPLDFSIDAWDGKTVNAKEFNENYAGRGTQTKTIDSAASFVYFVNEVNGGNSFEDYTVYLNKNIDLSGFTINSIGTPNAPFKGVFDGGYYTIFNANINGDGLFGCTDGAEIKNLGTYNSTINSKSDYAGGLIGKAINTNISNSFVRLNTINGKNVGGLVGEYISNNGEHNISNSFVDLTINAQNVGGLIYKLDTNNSNENLLTIYQSYYTQSDSAVAEKLNQFIEEDLVVKAVSKSSFANWSYVREYETGATWCDYDHHDETDELDFNFPVQAGFVKVYLTGSGYEGVVVTDSGKTVDTQNLAEAFKEADKESEAEVNLLVEKIFMEARAEVKNDIIVTVNAVKDTTIVRGEHNDDSMFVATGNSKIVLGTDPEEPITSVSTSAEEIKTLVLDGNIDEVKENSETSGALVVSYGAEVDIHNNVILQNNVNNNVGYGGAVLLYETSTQSTVSGYITNCHAEYAGGGVCSIGTAPEVLGKINYCSTEGKGGGAAILEDMEEISSVRKMNSLYGNGLNVKPVSVQYTTATTLKCGVSSFVGNTGSTGGAIFASAKLTFDQNGMSLDSSRIGRILFEDNVASYSGGAIWTNYGSSSDITRRMVVQFAYFDSNIVSASQDGMGGAVYSLYGIDVGSYSSFYSNRVKTVSGSTSGGAILTNSGTGSETRIYGEYVLFSTNGSAYSSNQAENTTLGGAIYSKGPLSISGSVGFTNNMATNSGGAVYVGDALTISGSPYFYTNKANMGGALYIDGNSDAAITGASFVGNTSSYRGGGIYTTGALSFTNVTASDNSSSSDGGFAFGSATSLSGTCNFTDNSSSGCGGALCVDELGVWGTANFTNNSSTNWFGGAVRVMTANGVLFYDGSNTTFNGNKANNASNGYAAAISSVGALTTQSGSTLTIKNSQSVGAGGAVVVEGNATFAGNVTFENNKSTANNAGALFVHGTLTMTGTQTFTGNQAASYGGAILCYGTCTISGTSTFSSNTCGRSGGAICADGAISVSGATFSGNIASNPNANDYAIGGAIKANGSSCTIGSNTSFTGNSATAATATNGYGGAIATAPQTPLTISGSNITFSNNSASWGGGAVNVDGSASISNATFTGNTAVYGGALRAYPNTTASVDVQVSNSVFSSNQSVKGGAIFTDTTISISGTTFSENKAIETAANAYAFGGAIATYSPTLTIGENTSFNGNSVSAATATYGYGGAVWVSSNTSLIINGKINTQNITFTNNTSSNGGGAINCDGTFSIQGALFESNSAQYGGALALTNSPSSSQYFASTIFDNNTARWNGGAISYSGTGDLNIGYANFTQNTATNGGALIVEKAKVNISHTDFASNTAMHSVDGEYHGGGAIHCVNNSAVQLTIGDEVVFSGNAAVNTANATYGCGGAIMVHSLAKLTISGNNVGFSFNGYNSSTLINGTSHYTGHGAAIFANGTVDITSAVEFSNNKTATDGGAIYSDSSLNISGATTFASNTSGTAAIFGSNNSIITFSNTASVLFDKNSTTIYGAPAIAAWGSLIFNNSAEIMFRDNISNQDAGAIYVSKSVSFNNSGLISFLRNKATNKTGGEYGGAIFYNGSTAWSLQNAVFEGNEAYYGGAIYSTAPLTLKDGSRTIKFKNNIAYGHGGAIYARGLTFENNDMNVEFTGNSATTGQGGAILYDSSTEFTVQGATFTNNTTTREGGAILSYGGADLHVNGASFITNSAGTSGGAIYSTGKVFVEVGTFNGNRTTTGNGGAISSEDDVSVVAGTFTNNVSGNAGGAICANGTTANIEIMGDYNDDYSLNVRFINNSAIYGGAVCGSNEIFINTAYFEGNSGTCGGAVLLEREGDILNSIENCIFAKNTADFGGAIYSNHTNLSVDGTAFGLNEDWEAEDSEGNKFGNSAISGGAIYTRFNATLGIGPNGTVDFYNNTATENGGAVCSEGNVELGGRYGGTSIYQGNSAKRGGAVHAITIYVSSDIPVENEEYYDQCGDTIFRDNTALEIGGAIYAEELYIELVNEEYTFTSNSAGTAGGAIYAGYVQIYDQVGGNSVSFNSNSVTSSNGDGAAIACDSLDLWCDVTFDANFAQSYGGQIFAGYVDIAGNITITDANGAEQVNIRLHGDYSSIYLEWELSQNITVYKEGLEFYDGSNFNSAVIIEQYEEDDYFSSWTSTSSPITVLNLPTDCVMNYDDVVADYGVVVKTFTKPTLSTTSYLYKNATHTITPANWTTLSNYMTISGNTGKDVGTYTLTISLMDYYKWNDAVTAKVADVVDVTKTWNIIYPTLNLYDETGATKKQTVYPKYQTANVYNGSKSSTTTSITVPTKTGYTFAGWYTAKTGGSQVIKPDKSLVTSAVTDYVTSSATWAILSTPKSLYERWTANTYSVKYNGNGATSGSMSNSTHTYDTAKQLTANGFARAYTVTYNYNGNGSSNTTATATYSFKNWNTVAGGTGTSYADKASVKNLSSTQGATVNLYAQWDNTVASAKVTLPTPTRVGYTFVGWNTKADGTGTSYSAGATYTPTANITLYAIWTPNTYSVKYNGNGATSGSMSNSTHTYDVAKALTAENFTRAYTVTYNYNGNGTSNTTATATYSFKNWNTVAGGTGTSYADKASVKNLSSTQGATVNLYAQWDNTVASAKVTLPTPTRTGYTFAGWYTATSGGSKVGAGGASYTPTANITLYAIWTANIYKVTLDNQGATTAGTTAYWYIYKTSKTISGYNSTVYFYSNSTCTTPIADGSTITKPTKTGYTFGGYFTATNGGGTQYVTASGACTNSIWSAKAENTTLYAKWTAIAIGDGTGFGGGSSTIYVTPGDTEILVATIEADGGSGSFTYTLTDPNSSNFYFNTKGTTSISSTSSVKLYLTNPGVGNWTCKVTATDNNNGLTKTSETYTVVIKYPTLTLKDDSSTTKQTVYPKYNTTTVYNGAQSSTTTSITTPTARTGYTFAGWYTAVSGGSKVINADKTLVANVSDWTSNSKWALTSSTQTLYERWSANIYDVTFDPNGGSVSPASKSVTYNSTYGTLATPTRTGYSFNGWYHWGDLTRTHEWEVGAIAAADGSNSSTTTRLRIKNYISVESSTTYSYKMNTSLTNFTVFYLFEYTADGTFVKSTDLSSQTKSFTTQATTTRIRFSIRYTNNVECSMDLLSQFTLQLTKGSTAVLSAGKVEADTIVATASNHTLVASWSAGTVNYKVNHYYEKIDNSTTMSSSNVGTTADSSLTVTQTLSGTADVSVTPARKAKTGFTSPSAQTVTIAADGSTVVNYFYTRNYYVLTLSAGTGISAVTGTGTYDYGKSVAINATVKTGYTWSTWTKSSGTTPTTFVAGTKSQNIVMGAGAVTLTASATANTYSVKYNGNGATSGSTASSSHTYDTAKQLTANGFVRAYTVTYNYNGNGSSNTTATATYSFKNWNTVAGGTGTSYADKASVKNLSSTQGATVNLYAQWDSASVTLPTPTRTGYTFAGWYDATSGGNKIGNGGASYTPTANKTIYAQWTANTYTVKFNGNGSTSGSMSDQAFTYDVEQNLTKENFTRQYTVTFNANGGSVSTTSETAEYSFAGWATSASGNKVYDDQQIVSNLTTTANGTVNLYANWTSKAVTLPTPTRAGYTFAGWNTKEDGTGTNYTSSTYTPTATTTLYAQWTENGYTVTFNPNGGSVSTTTKAVTFASTYGTLPTPTRTGYTFAGWYHWGDLTRTETWEVGAITFADGNVTTGNLTRLRTRDYISVEASTTYTLKMDTSLTSFQIFYVFEYTEGGTFIKSTELSTLSKTFTTQATTGKIKITLRYSTNATCTLDLLSNLTLQMVKGSTAVSSVGEIKSTTVVATASNHTLVASWTANTYSVKYNGNGATSGSMSNSSHTYDTAKQLTANGFVRAYTVTYNYNGNGTSNTTATATYSFKNWNTVAGGTGTSYTNQASVKNLSSTQGATVNLYAQWDSASVTLPTPTRTGYTFAGWYTAASGGSKVGNGGGTVTPTSSATYYAHWTINQYILALEVKVDGTVKTASELATLGITVDFTVAGTAKTAQTSYSSKVDYGTKYQINAVNCNTTQYTVTVNTNEQTMGTADAKMSVVLTTRTYRAILKFNNGYDISVHPTNLKITVGGGTLSSSTVSWGEEITWDATYSTNSYSITIESTNTSYNYHIEVALDLNGDGQTDEWPQGTNKLTYSKLIWSPVSNKTFPITVFEKFSFDAESGTGIVENGATAYGSWKTTTESSDLRETWQGNGITFKVTEEDIKDGYTWDGWYNGTTRVSTDMKYTYCELGNPGGAGLRANVSLTAKATANTYTVTFDSNGGTGSMNSVQYSYDTTNTLPKNTFTRTGYTFGGWTTLSQQATTRGNSGSDDFGNYILKKSTDAQVYSTDICLNSIPLQAGKTYIWSIEVYPVDYTMARHFDANVHSNESSSNDAGYSEYSQGGNYYLPANQWSVVTLTITTTAGYTNLRTTSALLMDTFSDGTKVIGSGKDVKVYYRNSMFYEVNNEDKYFADQASVKNLATSGTVTLHAIWKPNTYTVAYNGNGSTDGSMDNQTFTYDVAQNLRAENFARAYTVTYNYNGNGTSNTTATATYSFAGWKIVTDNYSYAKYGTSSSTVTTAITSSTIVPNGAFVINLTPTNGYTVNANAQWTSKSVTLPTPTRTGYTFAGWYDATSGGNKIGNGGASYTPTANKTIYAQWTPNIYKVTLDNQGATTAGTTAYWYKFGTDGYYTDSACTTLMNGDGQKITVPTKTGYTFGGYYTATNGGGQLYVQSSGQTQNGIYKVAANSTLYAKWTAVTYEICYMGNDATSGSMSNSTHTYDVAQNLTANAYERKYTVTYNYNGNGASNTTDTANYTFAGWSWEEGVKAVKHADKESVKNLRTTSGTYYLYAQWTSKSVTLPTPTRAGYIFKGWATSSTGTTSVDSDNDGLYTPTANITLYAIWEAKLVQVNISVKNDWSTDLVSGCSTSGTYKIGDVITLKATSTQNNIQFYSWQKDGAEYSTSSSTSYTITEADVNAGTEINFVAWARYIWTHRAITNFSTEVNGTGGLVSDAWQFEKSDWENWTETGYGRSSIIYSESNSNWNLAVEMYAQPKEGYEFYGWYLRHIPTAENYTTTAVALASDCEYVESSTYGNYYSYRHDLRTVNPYDNQVGGGIFYALFLPIEYKVNFDANGGTVDTTSKDIEFNAPYGTLPTPTRYGYTFNGWYGKNLIDINAMLANNVLVDNKDGTYSIWRSESGRFSNSFKVSIPANTKFTVSVETVDYNGTYAYPFQIQIFFADGTSSTYGFNSNANSWTHAYSKDITNIKIYQEGNMPVGTYTKFKNFMIEIGETATEYAPYVAYDRTANNGFVSEDMLVKTAYTHTLVASWTAISSTVTFDGNGVTVDPTSKTVTYDGTYGTLPTPTRTGYTFNGWNMNVLKAGMFVDESAINSTTGKPIPTYSGFFATPDFIPVKAGDKITSSFAVNIYKYDSNKNFINYVNGRTSFEVPSDTAFVKFEVNKNQISYENAITSGSINMIVTSNTVVKATVDHTLTAKWTANKYKVTLDNQGADTAGTTAYWYLFNTHGDHYYYLDEDLTIGIKDGNYITKPTRTGYTFGGYWTSKGGTGTQYISSSGQAMNNMYKNVASNTTLYAKWTINSYDVSLKFTIDGVDATQEQLSQYSVSANFKVGATTNSGITSYSQAVNYGTTVQITGVTYNNQQFTVSYDSNAKVVGTDGLEFVIALTTIEYSAKVTYSSQNATAGTTIKVTIPSGCTVKSDATTGTINTDGSVSLSYGQYVTFNHAYSTEKVAITMAKVTSSRNYLIGSYVNDTWNDQTENTHTYEDWIPNDELNIDVLIIEYMSATAITSTGIESAYFSTVWNGNDRYHNATSLSNLYRTETVNFTAKVKEGYSFDGWYNGTTKVSSDINYTISSITEDAILTAKATLNTYNISVGVNDAESGSVTSNGGVVNYGTKLVVSGNTVKYNDVTITANAKTNTAQYTYKFDGFFIDNEKFEGEITVTSDVAIEARFTRTVNQYTVTIKSNDNGLGTVNKTSVTVDWGTSISVNGNKVTIGGTTFTATPNSSTAEYTYSFSAWDGVTSTVTSDMTITAIFESMKNPYKVTIAVNNGAYGSVTNNEVTVEYGTSISTSGNTITIGGHTITANPTANSKQYSYAFVNWTGVVSKVEDNVIITANFSRTTNKYTVTIDVNNSTYGSVDTKSITVDYGTNMSANGNILTIGNSTVVASTSDNTPQYTYDFAKWSGVTATVTDNMKVTAEFTRVVNQYTISFNVNIAGFGTVDKDSVTVDWGTPIKTNGNIITIGNNTITATAYAPRTDDGYTYSFSGWENNATKVEANRTITANFTRNPNTYTITYDLVVDGATVSGNPSTYTILTDTITLKNPTLNREGFTFAGWIGEGITEPSKNVTIVKGSIGNRTYTAVWLVDMAIEVTGNNGNNYGIKVVGEDGEKTYTTSTQLIYGKNYTLYVFTNLKANENDNEYQIFKFFVDGVLEISQNSLQGDLTNSSFFSGTIEDKISVKFNYFDAYVMNVSTVGGITGLKIETIDNGNNIVMKHTSSTYVITYGTDVNFSVDSTPSQTDIYTFIGFQYIKNGTTYTIGVNGGTDIKYVAFEHNPQYYNDSDIGVYSYTIGKGVQLSDLVVRTVISQIVEINSTPITSGKITLTSEYGFNKVIDSSTSAVILYSGTWTVTTDLSLGVLEQVFAGYIVEKDANGVITVTVGRTSMDMTDIFS